MVYFVKKANEMGIRKSAPPRSEMGVELLEENHNHTNPHTVYLQSNG